MSCQYVVHDRGLVTPICATLHTIFGGNAHVDYLMAAAGGP